MQMYDDNIKHKLVFRMNHKSDFNMKYKSDFSVKNEPDIHIKQEINSDVKQEINFHVKQESKFNIMEELKYIKQESKYNIKKECIFDIKQESKNIKNECKFGIKQEPNFNLNQQESKYNIKKECKFSIKQELKYNIKKECKFGIKQEPNFNLKQERDFSLKQESNDNIKQRLKLQVHSTNNVICAETCLEQCSYFTDNSFSNNINCTNDKTMKYNSIELTHSELSKELKQIESQCSSESNIKIKNDKGYEICRNIGKDVHSASNKFKTGEEKAFTCNGCKVQFPSLQKLQIYICRHTENSYYFCDTCKKSLMKKKVLKTNFRMPSSKFQCDICKRIYSKKLFYMSHMLIHKKDKPFDL
ncbi:zinc finger protein 184-like [Centruroides sculpturatus]|uniref:zinc finger protein 184-like n=1 Tax=Centruroides sculpturatus TaxID=218467 RepID=UPI000C6E30FA|nr:zinc finger protein 184-like [Centruroides sculpturatus]